MRILYLTILFSYALAEEDDRLRGIAPQLAALYDEKEEFQCLDGSKTIPYTQVNDDYCDCEDGSDEPGTSACANGRFYCRNVGHRAESIPSSRVNDFICDCCDGSDEWDSGVQCPNVCDALGAKAREAAKQKRAIYASGYAKRTEMSKQGAKSMEEKKSELGKLKKELEELEPLKASTEEAKNKAEQTEKEAKDKEDSAWNTVREEKHRQRAQELFSQLDVDKDQKISMKDLQSFKELDSDADEKVSEDEAKSYLINAEEVDFEAFLSSSYTQLASLFKKPKPLEEPPTKKEETTEAPPTEDETAPPEASETDEDLEDDIEPEPPVEKDAEDQKPPYTAETQALIDEAEKARQAHREAMDKVNDLETTIKDSESFLEFEYGPDHAWAPLKGQCFELNVAQYIYKLCLFDRATQKDKNGYSETTLGNWRKWAGPESDKYSAQLYDKGQSCWNGPERSTHVEIVCGEETRLMEANEPAKCEYRFVLESPAACTDPAKLDEQLHTEL
jgi:protein kinase C substrate 80K-H